MYDPAADSISKMLEVLHLTERTFQRIFKKYVGLSGNQYRAHLPILFCFLAIMVQVPWAAASTLAEEQAGLPAADLRFESLAPVTGAAGALWSRTARFACRQLIESGDTEISPLLAQEMTQMVAAVMLRTFPSTTMTVPYLPSPGWAPPAAVRGAAEFMEAHAGEPVTTAQIAAAAGVTTRTLQDAFRRHTASPQPGICGGSGSNAPTRNSPAPTRPAASRSGRSPGGGGGSARACSPGPTGSGSACRPAARCGPEQPGTGEVSGRPVPWFWWDG